MGTPATAWSICTCGLELIPRSPLDVAHHPMIRRRLLVSAFSPAFQASTPPIFRSSGGAAVRGFRRPCAELCCRWGKPTGERPCWLSAGLRLSTGVFSTSNIQHPTSNNQRPTELRANYCGGYRLGCWALNGAHLRFGGTSLSFFATVVFVQRNLCVKGRASPPGSGRARLSAVSISSTTPVDAYGALTLDDWAGTPREPVSSP